MRTGIYFDLRNPPPWERDWHTHYARTLDLVVEAESLGIDSVWLTEHHFFEDGYLPQPLTFAAAIAARTTRVRIGTAVLILTNRDVVHLAEEAAIVDVLSGGRLDLGLGVGYRIPELERFGVPMRGRYALFEDKVRDLRDAFASHVTPAPLQSPLPLWAGFTGPRGARIAGRNGMGLLLVGGTAELRHVYESELAAHGHPVGAARYKMGVEMLLADDPDEAWPRIAPHLSYQRNTYRRYAVEGSGHPVPADRPPEDDGGPHLLDATWRRSHDPSKDLTLNRVPVLTVDEAVRYVTAKVGSAPVEEIWCWATIAGMPDDLAARNVELLATQLAPRLAFL